MRWTLASLALATLVTVVSLTDAMAQSSTVRGGVGGAVIGGAVGGGRGAAIGATTGVVVGANRDRRRNVYYRRDGRCWVRSTHGRSHQVSTRHCRR